MGANVGHLRRMYQQAVAEKSNFEGQADQIEKFCCPGVGGRAEGASSDEAAVSWKRDEVWDFTAILGLQRLAAQMHGTITSPAVRWFGFTTEDRSISKDNEILRWLEQLTDTVFEMLQTSDFNVEILRAYLDLCAFGNAFLSVEARHKGEAGEGVFDGLDFTSVPVREGFPLHDSRGRILYFFRRCDWTALQIVDRLGTQGVPDRILDAAASPERCTEKTEVVFAIYPREGLDPDDRSLELLPPDRRPWGACYFLAQGEEDVLGAELGYYECPVFHARWEVQAGSIWGRGPGLTILPTVKLLNALLEADLNAVEKVVDPPLLTTERGVLSDIDLGPGGLTAVRSPDSITPLESRSRFDITAEKIMMYQGQIRRALHEDDLQLKDAPAMTATEAQIRFELMNRVLGSTLAMLQSDVLDLVLMLSVGVALRNKLTARIPPKLLAVARRGKGYGVQYLGSLSRAQRTDEVAAVERTAAFVAALAKLEFTEARDVFDPVAAVREVAQRLGVPAAVLRPEEEVRRMAQERMAMAKAQAQAEVVRAQGEAAEQVADAANAGASVPAAPPPLVTPTV